MRISDEKELDAAVRALDRWFASQEIDPRDRLPVMISLTAYTLFQLGKPEEGAQLVVRCLLEAVNEASHGK